MPITHAHRDALSGPPAYLVFETAAALTGEAEGARAARQREAAVRLLARWEGILAECRAGLPHVGEGLLVSGASMASVGRGREVIATATELIDDLRETEARLAETHRAGRRLLGGLLRLARQARLTRTADHKAMVERYDALSVAWLEFLRDARWQLMAVRATLEGRAAGPVLSNGKVVRAHLARIAA